MYAVVKTGGKQYRVSVGDEIFVEKMNNDVNDEITFDEVLAVSDDDGLHLGDKLTSAKITGEVLKQGRGKKIVVFKYKAKKGYRRKKGHRQPYTRVRITGISL